MLVVANTPFVGSWIVDNLLRHGDALNDGMLYPVPHRLEEGLRAYEAHTEGAHVRHINGAISGVRRVVTFPIRTRPRSAAGPDCRRAS